MVKRISNNNKIQLYLQVIFSSETSWRPTLFSPRFSQSTERPSGRHLHLLLPPVSLLLYVTSSLHWRLVAIVFLPCLVYPSALTVITPSYHSFHEDHIRFFFLIALSTYTSSPPFILTTNLQLYLLQDMERPPFQPDDQLSYKTVFMFEGESLRRLEHENTPTETLN